MCVLVDVCVFVCMLVHMGVRENFFLKDIPLKDKKLLVSIESWHNFFKNTSSKIMPGTLEVPLCVCACVCVCV